MEQAFVKLQIAQGDSARGLPLPSYSTEGSAGLDITAALPEGVPVTLLPGERQLIPTGLKLAIPVGYEGQIRARSGLALKYGIGLINAPGTIDADYRGELQVLLVNWGHEPVTFSRGERIAQLVIAPVAHVSVVLCVEDELEPTLRGESGFGSTGIGSSVKVAPGNT